MEVLGLPEEIRPLLIVAFGKPAEEIHLVDVPKRTLADELLN